MRKFGKHAPRLSYRTPKLRHYLSTSLPPAPATYNALVQVCGKLSLTLPEAKLLFPMDGNDQYGDCTCAAMAHAIAVYNGMVGKQKILTAQQVEAYYFALTGGPDSGLDEQTVLSAWKGGSVGGQGEQILGYVSVDITNREHVKQAIALFGGLYIGFQVQNGAEQAFDARAWWEPDALTQDGHAVYVVAYDDVSVTCLTWGDLQTGTWSWWDACVDEAYAILPPQAKQADFDVGFNFTQLQADLAAL